MFFTTHHFDVLPLVLLVALAAVLPRGGCGGCGLRGLVRVAGHHRQVGPRLEQRRRDQAARPRPRAADLGAPQLRVPAPAQLALEPRQLARPRPRPRPRPRLAVEDLGGLGAEGGEVVDAGVGPRLQHLPLVVSHEGGQTAPSRQRLSAIISH